MHLLPFFHSKPIPAPLVTQHPQTLTIVLKAIFLKNNTKGYAAVTSPLPWHILSYYLLFFAILLNDSYGFHIRARHMYVLPRGCAHGENT